MKKISRRQFILTITIGTLALQVSSGRVWAIDKAALLVAAPGRLGDNLENMNGMRVAAGARANDPASGYPELFQKHGATLLKMPFSERYEALTKGVCDALFFTSPDKTNDELKNEILIFLPPLQHFEFRPFPYK